MNAMYSGEQIHIPEDLGAILKQFTKAAIRDAPKDASLLKWAANYFAAQAGQDLPFDEAGRLTSEGGKPRTSGSAAAAGPMVSDVLDGAGDYEAVEGTAEGDEAIIQHIFDQYDKNGTGRIDRNSVDSLVADLKASMGIDFSEEQQGMIMEMLEADEDGTIDLEEFRQLFFQSE